jgi:acyl carrier protein
MAPRAAGLVAEGNTVYKTGDLARWLPDGNIEFLGRMDSQVKVRGFRIELGEIETQLIAHDGIKEAVVIDVEDENNEKYLCAYIVAGNKISPGDLREFLLRRLPGYMVPSFFVRIEEIPLTPSGKIDKNALPKSQITVKKEYRAPTNDLEREVTEIWARVLNLKKDIISTDDNFFHIGGHSLRAVNLAAGIHKAFNVKIPLTGVFKNPTVKGLSAVIKDLKKESFAAIEVLEEKEYYTVSSTQRRLFFLQRMDPGNKSYNIPLVLLLEGEIDKEQVREVYRQLIRRHESFRTSFLMADGEPVQQIPRQVDFDVAYHKAGEGSGAYNEILKSYDCVFDLGSPPLFRVGLIKVGTGRHIIVNNFHHIIFDGVSLGIFVSELMNIYNEQRLPLLRVQYKDYADWQNRKPQQEALKKQEDYWLREFSGELPVLNLPTDYMRPEVFVFEGDAVHFTLDAAAARSLNELALEEGATLYMVLLAIFTVFMARLTGQHDIVVGTSATCRQHENLEDIIGMFVNALAMRNFPAGEKTFRQFLNEVKERTLAAFDNQDYQFEDLVNEVVDTRDSSRNPIFDVMFVLNNEELPELEIPGLKLTQYRYEEFSAQMDLKLRSMERRGEILLSLEYSTKLFKKETIERYIANFMEVISAVLADKEIRLEDIAISHGLLSPRANLLEEEEQGDFVF